MMCDVHIISSACTCQFACEGLTLQTSAVDVLSISLEYGFHLEPKARSTGKCLTCQVPSSLISAQVDLS